MSEYNFEEERGGNDFDYEAFDRSEYYEPSESQINDRNIHNDHQDGNEDFEDLDANTFDGDLLDLTPSQVDQLLDQLDPVECVGCGADISRRPHYYPCEYTQIDF